MALTMILSESIFTCVQKIAVRKSHRVMTESLKRDVFKSLTYSCHSEINQFSLPLVMHQHIGIDFFMGESGFEPSPAHKIYTTVK